LAGAFCAACIRFRQGAELFSEILPEPIAAIRTRVSGCRWRGPQWRLARATRPRRRIADFSPAAQRKAHALAAERQVKLTVIEADVHAWAYPELKFDVVFEIFAQFSSPADRAVKWAAMRRTLKPGGLPIMMGYTPKQLEYGTGGPKQLENLYTRAMLQQAFGDFRDLSIVEEELEMREGTSHAGMSAVIGLTALKP
jgi:hypothetical protein